jgi:cysteine synthase
MATAAETITPTEARRQLEWLRGANEAGDDARKSELRAIIRAADEVEETDPAEMLKRADRLESWAAHYDTEGREFQATENREIAARYRRCADRALGLKVAA